MDEVVKARKRTSRLQTSDKRELFYPSFGFSPYAIWPVRKSPSANIPTNIDNRDSCQESPQQNKKVNCIPLRRPNTKYLCWGWRSSSLLAQVSTSWCSSFRYPWRFGRLRNRESKRKRCPSLSIGDFNVDIVANACGALRFHKAPGNRQWATAALT